MRKLFSCLLLGGHPTSQMEMQLRPVPSKIIPTVAPSDTNPINVVCKQACQPTETPDEDNDNKLKSTETDNELDTHNSQMTSQSVTSAESSNPFLKSNTPSRDRRSVSYIEREAHTRNRRGNLNTNFLRFGRSRLNNNFLRFGRGNLKQNFLRFGRSDLSTKNYAHSSSSSDSSFFSDDKSEVNDDRYPLNLNDKERESFQTLDNLNPQQNQNGGEENASDMKSTEQQTPQSEIVDGKSIIPIENDDYDDEDQYKTKRGSLRDNFIRFGRYYKNVFSGKRGSLNRNFLRFGKRTDPQQSSFRMKLDDSGSDGINQENDKTDSDINFIQANESKQLYADNVSARIKRSTSFMPRILWLNKNGDHHTNDDTDNNSIRKLVHRDIMRLNELPESLI